MKVINKISNYIFNLQWKNKRLYTLFLIFSMAIVSETSLSVHDLGQKILWSLLALVGFLLFLSDKNKGYEYKIFKICLLGAIPYIVAAMYTLLLSVLGISNGMGIEVQAFTTSMYALVDMCLVGALIYIYKDKAIDIVYWFITCSYAITLFITTMKYGLLELIKSIIGISAYADILERHDIGTAVVAIILYYLYHIFIYKDKNNQYFIRLIILLGIMFLCGKRSAYMAILLPILMIFLLSRYINNKSRFTYIILITTIVICFLFVCAIKYSWINLVFDFFGLDTFRLTTGRLYVWQWFNDQYQITINFLGKGFQYIHRYMMLGMAEPGVEYSLVNNFGYLHNSVLQIFIELGFIGWFLWYGFFLGIYPYIIKKILGSKTFLFSSIIIIMMVINYMTDNTLTYPVFQITCYSCIFSIAVGSDKTKVLPGGAKK